MSTNLNLRALDFTFDQLESKSKKTKKNVEKTCISNSGLAFKITAKRVNDTSNPLGFLGLRKKTAYTVTLLSSKFAETCSQAIHNGTKESVMKIINSRQKKFSQMSSTNRAFAMQEQANQLLQSGKSEQALQLLTQSRDILQTPEGKKNFEANPSKMQKNWHQWQANLLRQIGGNSGNSQLSAAIQYHDQQANWLQKKPSERANELLSFASKTEDPEQARACLLQSREQFLSPEGQQEWQQMGPLDRTIYLQMSADILCKIGTSKEILSDFKNQIRNEINSPAGMAAFAQLPHDERAEICERQVRLLEALEEDPQIINRFKEKAARERIGGAFAMQEQANQLLQSGKSEQALQLLTQSRDILQTPDGKKNFAANSSAVQMDWHQRQANLLRQIGGNSGNSQLSAAIQYHDQQANWLQKKPSERANELLSFASKTEDPGQAHACFLQAREQFLSPEGQQEWQQMGPLDRTIYLQMSADILCKIGTSKEILSDFENQIRNEMESPAGMAAFAQLPHDKRAEFYEQQGRLSEALGEDPKTINWNKENAARERIGGAFDMQEQANQLLQSGKSEQALQLLTQSRDILQTPEGKKNFEANPSAVQADWHQRQANLLRQIGGNSGNSQLSATIQYHDQQANWLQKKHSERANELLSFASKTEDPGQAYACFLQAREQFLSPEGQQEWQQMGPLDRTIYLQMSADILCKIGTSKEILSDLKNQILNEMESPAGMAAFAQLPHDKRAEVYEQQGRLLEALGEDPETINWYKENAARERTEDFRQAPRSLEKENAARELLGVGPNATPQEIRKAYHALALKLHPDKNRDDPEATAKFQELNNAFDLLKNAKPA